MRAQHNPLTLCLILPWLSLASPALSDPLVSDAFGLFDPKTDPDRAAWAGYRDTPAGWTSLVPPGRAAELLLFVGQKTLVAGQETGQAAALALDAAGNLAAENKGVTFTLDGQIHRKVITNGIAAHRFEAGPKAGQYLAGASVGAVQSLRAEYEIIPDLLSLSTRLPPDTGEAQVETFQDLTSAPLTDRFGNPASLGTGALFVMQGQDGSYGLLPGQVTAEGASGRLFARDLGPEAALSGQMRLAIGTALSEEVAYQVQPLRPRGPIGLRSRVLVDLGVTRMELGPFLTDGGYLLADGAPITVELVLADGRVLAQEAWAMDGKTVIDWLLPDLTGLELRITTPLGRLPAQRVPSPEGDQP